MFIKDRTLYIKRAVALTLYQVFEMFDYNPLKPIFSNLTWFEPQLLEIPLSGINRAALNSILNVLLAIDSPAKDMALLREELKGVFMADTVPVKKATQSDIIFTMGGRLVP